MPVAVCPFSTPARALERAWSVEEVAHEAPCPSRVLGWLLGREKSGAAAIQRRRTPRRSWVGVFVRVCPQGLFYQKFQPRQYPVLCIKPQLGLFLLPRICAREQGPAPECHLCARPRASSPDGLTHAVTSVVAYEWNHQASQSDSLTTSIDAMPCCWNRLSVCSWPRIHEALAVSSQGGGDTSRPRPYSM